MASSLLLHPSVRERHEPRMSATALAEYLILQADGQENILHDSRFARPPMVTANAEALRTLRAYSTDPRRDHSTLDRAKAALTAKSQDQHLKPKARDETRRCIESIRLFEQNENVFGLRAMSLREAPKLVPLMVEGVAVSIRPDFLVDGPDRRVGAGIIRVAKSPDPMACKMDETRRKRGDHRREMGRYMVALLQMLLEAQSDKIGVVDGSLCLVADVRLAERIGPAKDHSARLRTIRGACRQIAVLWPSIEPKPEILKKDA